MPRKKFAGKRLHISQAKKAFYERKRNKKFSETRADESYDLEPNMQDNEPVESPWEQNDIHIPTNFFYKTNIVQTNGIMNDSDIEDDFSLLEREGTRSLVDTTETSKQCKQSEKKNLNPFFSKHRFFHFKKLLLLQFLTDFKNLKSIIMLESCVFI